MDLNDCLEIRREIEGKEICLSCRFVGGDLELRCTGGDEAHIGAVSLALPYRNERGTFSASVSTLTVPGHRDDAISIALAERFAKAFGRTTAAVCGIHFEHASPARIQKILEIVAGMAGEMEEKVQGSAR